MKVEINITRLFTFILGPRGVRIKRYRSYISSTAPSVTIPLSPNATSIFCLVMWFLPIHSSLSQ
jgi:hypothetical protein